MACTWQKAQTWVKLNLDETDDFNAIPEIADRWLFNYFNMLIPRTKMPVFPAVALRFLFRQTSR